MRRRRHYCARRHRPATTAHLAIGGTVSGLSGVAVLQNNLGDNLTVSANGNFAFATALASGSAYSITVKTQPSSPTQTCVVGNATGSVAGAAVTNVTVTCTTNTYGVGGTVSGLVSGGLVLQDNGGDDILLSSSAVGFGFGTPIASGRDLQRHGQDPADRPGADLRRRIWSAPRSLAPGFISASTRARSARSMRHSPARRPTGCAPRALRMRARMRVGMGRSAQVLLGEAHALMALDGRRGLRASIKLDHALALDPPAALATAREVIAESERLGLPGSALAGHIRAMRFAVDAGRPDDAVLHAHACAAIDAEVMPSDLYPAEQWLHAWQAWQLAGRKDEALAALTLGAGWVRRALREQVPEPFRDSFVRANPVNQALLRAAESARLPG